MTMRIRTLSAALVAALVAFTAACSVQAAEKQQLIFDTEIETTIRDFATPVLLAAGLEPGAVRIHLVNSSAPNAFVSRGQRLFVTTGLLMSAEHPGQVIGTLAHETGHIAGGHLARLDTMLRDAAPAALLASLLGAAAGVLAQDSGAGMAVAGAGQHVLQQQLLAFSRNQEQAADRAAVKYLEDTRQSARGLMEFLEFLDDQQALFVSRARQRELAYHTTHPLTPERIDFVRQHVDRSRYTDVPVKPEFVRRYARVVAKLQGFLNHPVQTLRQYKESDRSVPARYARSIAYYRQSNLERAVPLIDGLLDQHPDDPYFLELKGQMLFENGRIAEALEPYQRSVDRLPNARLLRIGLAHVQIELNRADLLKPALENLDRALRIDRAVPLAWRLVATAHGRNGELGQSALASAEYAFYSGRRSDAARMAQRAQRLLKQGTPGWQRAQDILHSTEERK
jgi:predicted Zn-dependent protease